MQTRIICDTQILIFWQDDPMRLSDAVQSNFETRLYDKTLAYSDISFWEIAMLMYSGRLRNDISPVQYMTNLCLALTLTVLPIIPEIASLSQKNFFHHNETADRLIAATAIHHNTPLITADKKLKKLEPVTVIW